LGITGMSYTSADTIAGRWIAFYSTPEKQRSPDLAREDSWAKLPWDEPELCYSAILAAVKLLPADPANAAFQTIAAGPLENLLANHGPNIIAKVESEAKRNPAFNLLLGGVWKSSMTEEVWARVQAARSSVW
jgi:hypothetical protein